VQEGFVAAAKVSSSKTVSDTKLALAMQAKDVFDAFVSSEASVGHAHCKKNDKHCMKLYCKKKYKHQYCDPAFKDPRNGKCLRDPIEFLNKHAACHDILFHHDDAIAPMSTYVTMLSSKVKTMGAHKEKKQKKKAKKAKKKAHEKDCKAKMKHFHRDPAFTNFDGGKETHMKDPALPEGCKDVAFHHSVLLMQHNEKKEKEKKKKEAKKKAHEKDCKAKMKHFHRDPAFTNFDGGKETHMKDPALPEGCKDVAFHHDELLQRDEVSPLYEQESKLFDSLLN